MSYNVNAIIANTEALLKLLASFPFFINTNKTL